MPLTHSIMDTITGPSTASLGGSLFLESTTLSGGHSEVLLLDGSVGSLGGHRGRHGDALRLQLTGSGASSLTHGSKHRGDRNRPESKHHSRHDRSVSPNRSSTGDGPADGDQWGERHPFSPQRTFGSMPDGDSSPEPPVRGIAKSMLMPALPPELQGAMTSTAASATGSVTTSQLDDRGRSKRHRDKRRHGKHRSRHAGEEDAALSQQSSVEEGEMLGPKSVVRPSRMNVPPLMGEMEEKIYRHLQVRVIAVAAQ